MIIINNVFTLLFRGRITDPIGTIYMSYYIIIVVCNTRSAQTRFNGDRFYTYRLSTSDKNIYALINFAIGFEYYVYYEHLIRRYNNIYPA